MDQLAGKNALLLQTLHQMRFEKHDLEQRIGGLERQSGTLIAENIKLSSALISASKRARTARHAAVQLPPLRPGGHMDLSHHRVSSFAWRELPFSCCEADPCRAPPHPPNPSPPHPPTPTPQGLLPPALQEQHEDMLMMMQHQQHQLHGGRPSLLSSLHRSLSANAASDPALAHAVAAAAAPRPASAGPGMMTNPFQQQQQRQRQQQQQQQQDRALLSHGMGPGWAQALDLPLPQHHEQQQQDAFASTARRSRHLAQQQQACPSLHHHASDTMLLSQASAALPPTAAMLLDARTVAAAPAPQQHVQPPLPDAGPSGTVLASFASGEIAAALAADMGGLDADVADLSEREFQQMMEVLVEPPATGPPPALLLLPQSPGATPVSGMVPVAPSADPTAGTADPSLWDAMESDAFGLAAALQPQPQPQPQQPQQPQQQGYLHSPQPEALQMSPKGRQSPMLVLGAAPQQCGPVPPAQACHVPDPGSSGAMAAVHQRLLGAAEPRHHRLASAMDLYQPGQAAACAPTFSSCAQAAALIQQQLAQQHHLQLQPPQQQQEQLVRRHLMLDLSTHGSPCGLGLESPGLKPLRPELGPGPELTGGVLHGLEAVYMQQQQQQQQQEQEQQQQQLELHQQGDPIFFGSCDGLLDSAAPGGWPAAIAAGLDPCSSSALQRGRRQWTGAKPITMLGMAACNGGAAAMAEGSPAGENLSAATPSSATAWGLGPNSSSGCSVAGPLALACQMYEFL
jgi:hypothetical protein